MQNSTYFVLNITLESDQVNWHIMFDNIYLLNIVVTVVISPKLISGHFCWFEGARGNAAASIWAA